jgi:geranylgeranylglycerol-phosphate geranylgeranyltransferase
MVTGELHPEAALFVSVALMTAAAIVSWFLNPLAVLALVIGVLLNILYEYAKAWSLVGNAVFGASIATCTVYGFFATGPTPEPLFTPSRVCGVILVALFNALMTYYTYFKDYRGDRRAGKKTFVVRHGLHVGRVAGVVGAFLPTVVYFAMAVLGFLPFRDVLYTQEFTFCAVMTLFLQVWTAGIFYRHPFGPQTYFGLVINIRACVAGQIALIARFNGTLALYLFCASYVFIGFLFNLYKDEKA